MSPWSDRTYVDPAPLFTLKPTSTSFNHFSLFKDNPNTVLERKRKSSRKSQDKYSLLLSTSIPIPQFRKEPSLLSLLIPTSPAPSHTSIRAVTFLRLQIGEQTRTGTTGSTTLANRLRALGLVVLVLGRVRAVGILWHIRYCSRKMDVHLVGRTYSPVGVQVVHHLRRQGPGSSRCGSLCTAVAPGIAMLVSVAGLAFPVAGRGFVGHVGDFEEKIIRNDVGC